ncbi:hypothetical protein [Micromonospora sp. HUAS LYJ1]|uniref:hypothetical protein n=1 Tax=Micromonospora sp. HUAS LYJ1 TaxID=3061626 RepID=UPI0026718FFD|nr:hypothetical protein [Micromonospora sp. HUAS LYJ1]WKU03750.1 hypothetical protein Q2K16_23340 [Micromonospora sp. HUAS LYJ1]
MATSAQRKPKADEAPNTAQAAAEQVAAEGHAPGQVPEVTVAEGQVPGERQITAPGDGPADTTDPRERVSTVVVSGDKLAEAAKDGVGAVVGYVKTGEVPPAGDPSRDTSKDRYEEYEVGGVKLRRNLETGKSERI